jgi:hypothetical protein
VPPFRPERPILLRYFRPYSASRPSAASEEGKDRSSPSLAAFRPSYSLTCSSDFSTPVVLSTPTQDSP